MNIVTSFFLLLSSYGLSIRERFNSIKILWKHLHMYKFKWLFKQLQSLPFMKDNMLKQNSSSTNPKTWHMASLASFTYLKVVEWVA
jgi:hypothetical protein